MSNILYVTSFSEDLFKASGKKLISTYINCNMIETLLICYENFDYVKPNNLNLITYPLHESKYLNTWLDVNKDIIPDYLGGVATKENSPDIFNTIMKRKASRFFRKIASLEYALRTYGDQYDYIIWVDSDSYFIKNCPTNFVIKMFKDAGVIYHMGKERPKNKSGFETGWIGFQKKSNGFDILKEVIECYQDGSFRELDKWDDGFVFRHYIENIKTNKDKCVDLTPNCTHTSPIKYSSPLKSYFHHNKGHHFRTKVSR